MFASKYLGKSKMRVVGHFHYVHLCFCFHLLSDLLIYFLHVFIHESPNRFIFQILSWTPLHIQNGIKDITSFVFTKLSVSFLLVPSEITVLGDRMNNQTLITVALMVLFSGTVYFV